MKSKNIATLVALTALSVAAFAVTQGLSVKRMPKEGQTIKFALAGEIDFQGTPVTLNANVSEKVTKVNADGTYTVEQSQTDGKISIAGSDQDIPASPPSTTTYKANGEITEIKGDQDMANSFRMANLGLLYDAAKPLAVGDKWSYDIKADAKTGAAAAKADYELVAEEKVGKYDTLKIKASVKETEGTDPAESTGIVWIDKTDGSTVKSESEWKNAPFPGAPGPLNAKITLTRVD